MMVLLRKRKFKISQVHTYEVIDCRTGGRIPGGGRKQRNQFNKGGEEHKRLVKSLEMLVQSLECIKAGSKSGS